jgi:TPP-dependent pyruvate/acetoin dehydrogenase alpha subunit
MMEIPKGEYCENEYGEECPLWHVEIERCFMPFDSDDQTGYRKVKEGERLRTGDCLRAYPNGGTVTITPKEAIMANKVEELRSGIIQRLNNPEGLQEEEVDTLICAARAEGALKEREMMWKALLAAQFNDPILNPVDVRT